MWIVISIKNCVFEIAIFENGDNQKNWARFFKICKYTFFNI